MDISIVIISYNTAALLDNCLESIKRHTHGVTYEIIVIDNASADNSKSLVGEKHPTVRLIGNRENRGFSAAANQGITKALGDYVLLLNSDTLLRDDSLTAMVKFMREHPEVGGLNPRLLNGDGTPQVPGSSFLNIERWRLNRTHPLKWVSGAAALFPRKLLLEIGLLDEQFFFYNEDLDLSLRIRRAGYSLYYYHEAAVIHLGGQSTRHISGDALWYGYQGGFYYCRKHYGKLVYLIYKTAAVTDLGVRIAVLTILFPVLAGEKTRSRLTAYQRILKDALGGLI